MGIVRRVLVLRRIMLVPVFLFCIPTWVGFGLALIVGCRASFWLCVEQVLFGRFPAFFHSLNLFCFELIHVLAY